MWHRFVYSSRNNNFAAADDYACGIKHKITTLVYETQSNIRQDLGVS